MSYHAHRMLTLGASRKRKEMESSHGSTSLKPLAQQTAVSSAATSFKGAEPKPLSSNRLLAGYMAHEFLTKGTLLGEKFDPARADAAPLNKNKQVQNQNRAEPMTEADARGQTKPHGYAEVATLLKSDGVHIPGIVNPTQLGRWIQM